MNMKKIIVFLLSAAMIIPGGVIVSASDNEAVSDSRIVLLDKLGIISDMLDSDIELDAYMTRAEFVSCLVNILGIETEGAEAANHFVDVPSDYKYAAEVNIAYEHGIITSMYDNFFVPEAPLKTEQCAKMVMSLLGYDAMAEKNGGYPDGYMSVASSAGVLKNSGAVQGQYISYQQAFAILYNALNTDMMFTTISGGNVEMTIGEGETLLTTQMEVIKSEGQITATKYTSLESPNGVNEGIIEIDGVAYEDYTDDAFNYLGFNVDYYYIEDENAVVAVVPKKNTETVTINADDIVSYDNFAYEYEINGRVRKEQFSAKTTVIFNGRTVVSGYEDVVYKPAAGYVRFIDGDGDGDYEIIDIKSYQTIVVNGVVPNDGLITDKDDTTRNIEIEDTDDVFLSIIDENGEDMSLNEIEQYDIISAAVSLDKEIYELVVSKTILDGSITGLSYDGDDRVAAIDGEEYIVARDRQELISGMETGDSGTFYLDKYGHIAYFKESTSGKYQYGYLRKVYYNEAEDTITAKVLSAEGEMLKLTSDTKLYVNDVKTSAAKTLAPIVDDDSQTEDTGSGIELGNVITHLDDNMLIMYMTNSRGLLTKIQTLEGSVLRQTYTSGTASPKYWSSSRTFDAQAPVADDAVVFVIPKDAEENNDDSYYTAKKRAYLQNNKRYMVEAYNNDEKSDFAKAVVVKVTYNDPEVDQGVALVKEVSAAVNENDEVVSTLTVLYMGGEFEFKTLEEDTVNKAVPENAPTASPIAIEPGDVVRFAQNADNLIEEIRVVYDMSANKYMGSPTSSSLDAQYRSIYGSVYSIEDGMAKIYVNEDPIDNSSQASHTVEYYPLDKFNIYVYDATESKRNIYIGNVNDVMDFSHYGKYSRVLIQTKNGEPGAMVVYKR